MEDNKIPLLEEEGDEIPPEMTPEEVLAMGRHPVLTIQETFEALGLSASVLNAIHHIGFKHPTPIQAKIIPMALQGGDLIGLAQTGSRKTAAFVIPMAEKLFHHEG